MDNKENEAKTYSVHGLIEQLREAIKDEVPNSRERSLALTKLDECEMWVLKYVNF